MLLLDEHRGRLLETRALSDKESVEYKKYSSMLRLINLIKKQVSDVFDADQLSLGL
jgi:hypothetical protein